MRVLPFQRRLAPVLAVFAIMAFLGLGSCADASAWYPEGNASVAASHEVTDGTAKACVATIKVKNDGVSKINTSTVSVSVTTNARTYFKTGNSQTVILPGENAYFDIAVDYAGSSEVLQVSGVAVVGQYYQ